MNSINFIASNISYLHTEKFDIGEDFLDELKSFLSKNNVYYDEINRDIALRNETQAHLVPVMNKLFDERFICKYLDHIYHNDKFQSEEVQFYPKYIFLKTEQDDFLEFKYQDKLILIGDLHTVHQEISALANALGVNLEERDNYPGGKQKVAFNLIDISWSAINSSMPLIIF